MLSAMRASARGARVALGAPPRGRAGGLSSSQVGQRRRVGAASGEGGRRVLDGGDDLEESRRVSSVGAAAGYGGRVRVVDVQEKAGLVEETWSPKVIASINDYDVRLAKLEGDFVWHSHEDTDEMFMVVEGELRIELGIELDGREHVDLTAGQLFVIPKGVYHKPRTLTERCTVLLLEPSDTVNTGDAGGDMTADTFVWV